MTLSLAETLLLEAVRHTPRRYRLPPLPAGLEAARGTDAATAMAFALASVHAARVRGEPPPHGTQALFVEAMASIIRAAMAAPHGDPAHQALVLRHADAQVREYAALVRQAAEDRRALRGALDAIAHPGKLRTRPSAERERLLPLHALLGAQDWAGLRGALERAQAAPDDPPAPAAGDARALAPGLRAVLAHPALVRLERTAALLQEPGVQHYRAWLARAGPAAGSGDAVAAGRDAARRGGLAEAAVVSAFVDIADAMNRLAGGSAAWRAVRGLRTPARLAAARRAKAEWDAAIVREPAEAGSGAHLVLLAEVKSAPAAAAADWPRLLRGLAALAQASADASVEFGSADGPVALSAASLRALGPPADGLPAHAIYACTATPEPQPALLTAASKAVLLAQPESLDHAAALARGESPPAQALEPLWQAVVAAPQLRAVREQDAVARAARAAMLHPDDLRACTLALFEERGARG